MNRLRNNYLRNVLRPITFYWFLALQVLPFFTRIEKLNLILLSTLPLILVDMRIISYAKELVAPLALSVLAFFFSYNTNLGGVLDIFFIPGLLLLFVKLDKFYSQSFYRFFAIVIFIFNCIVVIIEYNSRINIFSIYDLDYFLRFRATGLWIHPLLSANIQAFSILMILSSTINKYIKFVLSAFGFYVIFLFDARVATLTLVGAASYILFLIGLLRKKNIIVCLIIAIIGYLFYDYLGSTDIGGKLFDSDVKMENEFYPRIAPFEMLANADFNTIMFGTDKELILKHYAGTGCVDIENGPIEMIFRYGVIVTSAFLYIYIKRLYIVMADLDKRMRIAILGTCLFVGFTSSSYSQPILWYAFIVFYKGFGPYLSLRNEKIKR